MNIVEYWASISQRQRYFSSLALLATVLLIIIVGAVLIWSLKDSENQFNREAAAIYQIVDNRLKSNEAVLGGLAALYHAVDDVDYDQLSLFSREMLLGYPHIYAINGQVRVTYEELETFQENMRDDGYLTYQVREYQKELKNHWKPVVKRPVYYPVIFLEPLEPDTVQMLGHDVYSDLNLKEAIEKAIDSGSIAASAPYEFVQGGLGYALFKPVYAGLSIPASRKDRFEQATRVVSLLIRIDQLVTQDDISDPLVNISLVYRQGENRNVSLTSIKKKSAGKNSLLSVLFSDFTFQQSLHSSGQDFVLEISKPVTAKSLHMGSVAGATIFVALFIFLLHMRQRYKLEYQRNQEDMFKHREREEVTLLSIADAVITTDEQGFVDHMNSTAEKLTEWEISSARGNPIQSIFKVTDNDAPTLVLDPVSQCLMEGRVIRLVKSVGLQGRLESRSEIEAIVSPTRNRDGNIIGTVLVFHDVSNVREMQDHINYQASHDPLTGLIHRREFEKCLKKALDSAHKRGSHHALLYMDIDQFRVLNENFGHLAGDELLVQISSLLRAVIREEDTLARLGGDEFSILLEDCPLSEAIKKADYFRGIVEEFNFVWQGKSFDVGFGIGVVVIDSSSGSVNEILKSADSACYAAKAKGRHQVVVYQADDPEMQKQRGEMQWATRISDALRNQKFQLYYQSILPLQENEPDVFHCELLMRTEGDSNDLISPEKFIPAAERYNLMGDIDRWVVSTAIQNITILEKNTSTIKTNLYGINLSGQSLSDESFFGYVSGLFEVYDVNQKNICFEVTETSAIVNPKIALNFIQEMKLRGCQFALDDFGTGVSSYSYLKMFPFDYVKIDGSFIRNVTSNSIDRVMVESVCRIANVMGIKTIAEFVEDDATLTTLRDLGVDYAQGYGIAEPASLTDLVDKAAILDQEMH